MNEVNIGVIGTGQIGTHHLSNYMEIEGANVVAVCDVDEKNLDKVCDKFGIKERYTDFRKMLERDDIDAVDVCLHNNLHAPVTISSLEAGKHVYCEKPIAGTYIDGKAMVDAAQKTGKKLHIQLSTLYEKETRAAKTLIEGGKLGRLYHCRSTGFRRRGRPYVDGYGSKNFVQKEIAAGGALFDTGIYQIAQLLYLVGASKIERISGKTYQETPIDEKRKSESGYSVEEMGLGFVRFNDGLTMDIIEAWAVHLNDFEGSSIAGSEGGIRLSPFSYHSTICDLEMDAVFNLDSMSYRRHQLHEDEMYFDSSQKHWIGALQGAVDLLPTAEIALQTMLIQEGIYLSDELGREVTADEVGDRSISKAAVL